jgi:hypothetical protein
MNDQFKNLKYGLKRIGLNRIEYIEFQSAPQLKSSYKI